jgi:hypothetical protein
MEEKVSYVFILKMYTQTPSDRVEERKAALFQAVPFLNCLKLFGRHFESRSTGMTKE